MKTRREARELILKILFQHYYGNVPLGQAVKNLLAGDQGADGKLDESLYDFVLERLNGVCKKRETLNEIIEGYAEGWQLDRMVRVDLIVLRLALFEILFCPEIPNEVAIDEAIDIAKEYSGEDSGRFVNGILGRFLAEEIKT